MYNDMAPAQNRAAGAVCGSVADDMKSGITQPNIRSMSCYISVICRTQVFIVGIATNEAIR